MTDNEIIKGMECVIGNEVNCSECDYQKVLPFPSCRMMCAKNALDLINRQKAEIERLKKNIDGLNIFTTNHIKVIRLQAMKEFAKRLKDNYCFTDRWGKIIPISTVDNLVKEMTKEVNKNDDTKNNISTFDGDRCIRQFNC